MLRVETQRQDNRNNLEVTLLVRQTRKRKVGERNLRRGMPQRSRGDVSRGDLSSFSFLPYEICRKHYPGACWVEHACKICGIKGHIERRCYDNPANKKKEDVGNDEDWIVRGI
jgi:hypothetical protein